MCLTTNFKGRIAKKAFYTFKFMDNPTISCCQSPYQGTIYNYNTKRNLNTEVNSEIQTRSFDYNFKNWQRDLPINYGFHSLRFNFVIRKINSNLPIWFDTDFDRSWKCKVIILCKIPKGAKYFYGDSGDIVSNKIEIIEPLMFNEAIEHDYFSKHFDFKKVELRCKRIYDCLPTLRKICSSEKRNIIPS